MLSVICVFIVLIAITYFFASIIRLLFYFIFRKNKKKLILSILTSVCCIIVFTFIAAESSHTSGGLVSKDSKTEIIKNGDLESKSSQKSDTQDEITITDKTKKEKQKKDENTKKGVAKTLEIEKTTENENYDTMSESDYKSLCTAMWHDDIFFSKTDLDNKLVKLELFVEEDRFYTIGTITTDTNLYDMLKKYNLKRSFFYCGVNRKNEKNGYASAGQLNLYISSTYKDTIKTGDHLIVYGQIIEYSRNTWDGYNFCSVVPKYITNNGQ